MTVKFLTIEEAAEVIKTECAAEMNPNTLRSWVRKCQQGDARLKGIPFHQIGKGFPITFDKDRLVRWWNQHTNIGVGNQ